MSLKGGTFMNCGLELLLPHARAYLRAGCSSNDVTSKNLEEDEIEGKSNRTNDYRTSPVVSTDCRAPTITSAKCASPPLPSVSPRISTLHRPCPTLHFTVNGARIFTTRWLKQHTLRALRLAFLWTGDGRVNVRSTGCFSAPNRG